MISGGGRYDGLIEEIGGPPTPGVGFGAGIERLLLALEAGRTCSRRSGRAIEVFIGAEAGCAARAVLRWLKELRAHGIAADTDYAGARSRASSPRRGALGAADDRDRPGPTARRSAGPASRTNRLPTTTC